MSTSVWSGVRGLFSVNGKKMAWASGVDLSEEIMYEPAEVLNNIEVQEHVPVGYRVTLSAEFWRTIQGTPGAIAPQGSLGSVKTLGVFPLVGKGPRGQNILLFPPMIATLHDPITNTQLQRVDMVRPASQGFSLTPRGIVGVRVGFMAIRTVDESGG